MTTPPSAVRPSHRFTQISDLLNANAGAQRLSRVFEDFIEILAITLRNAVDRNDEDDWRSREQRYLDIARHYDRPALDRFAHAFALVTEEMESHPRDVLGQLYMSLELGNENLGQFFTPYHLAQLLAAMNTEGMEQTVNERGFVTLHEPACGAGAFLVATSTAMMEASLDPQTQLCITAEGISPVAVHMTYVHLALLHVPALVHRRDTLTQETFETWPTPAYLLGGWKHRLAAAS
jgi:type I restriction-modification system DNA methylase subunit